MKIPELDTTLLEAFTELDIWLGQTKRTLYLEIIGASALMLHHIEISRQTIDVDLAKDIEDTDILAQIKEIGRNYGLDETWLEHPLNLELPEGAKLSDHKLFRPYKNITVKVVDVETLLVLKIAAYYDRREDQITDLEDIEAIVAAGYKITPITIDRSKAEIKKSSKYNLKEMNKLLKELVKLN